MLDLSSLLEPIAGDAPCGDDLRSDLVFRDIEESSTRFKALNHEELRAVLRSAGDLLLRTKDQLPALIALQAAARLGEVDDMVTVLRVLHHFIVDHWDGYHPGPPDEMLEARANELAALNRPAVLTGPLEKLCIVRLPAPFEVEINWSTLLQACEVTPRWTEEDDARLAALVETGQLSKTAAASQRQIRENGRQLRQIAKALSVEAQAADTAAGADADDDGQLADPIHMQALAIDLRSSVEVRRNQLQALSDLFYEISDAYEQRAGETPSFGSAVSQVRSMIGACDKFLATFAAPSAGEEGSASPTEEPGASAPGRNMAATSGALRNRDDVLTAIDAICRYYAAAEPGSPVPVMLRRVRNWVTLDFLGLMQEIAPENSQEIRKLLAGDSGRDDEQSS